MADILVLGYGNEERGDDGLGPHIAASVAALKLPGVRVRTAVQLLPELAADLAEVRLAFFVDAATDPSESAVQVQFLGVESATDWCTHCADPRPLLALTRALYAYAPQAWWFKVTGQKFDFGQGLSASAEKNACQAIACLKRTALSAASRVK